MSFRRPKGGRISESFTLCYQDSSLTLWMTDYFNDFIAPKFGKNHGFCQNSLHSCNRVATNCASRGKWLQESCHRPIFLSQKNYLIGGCYRNPSLRSGWQDGGQDDRMEAWRILKDSWRIFRREVHRNSFIFKRSEPTEAMKVFLFEMHYRASGGSFISLPAMRY